MIVYGVPVRLNFVMYVSTLSLWTGTDGTADMRRAQRERREAGWSGRERVLVEYNAFIGPGKETRLTGFASPASHLRLSAATSM